MISVYGATQHYIYLHGSKEAAANLAASFDQPLEPCRHMILNDALGNNEASNLYRMAIPQGVSLYEIMGAIQ